MRAANPKVRVDVRDPGSPWVKIVLEAAEFLAAKPLKLEGPEGRRYFVVPSPQLASLCRRWLRAPGPETFGPVAKSIKRGSHR
jgi:hypothetical protein